MGGEGHMLDMIKRMELNRQQKQNVKKSFGEKKKPPISTESFDEASYDYTPKEKKLSPKQKKIYRIVAIISLILILVVIVLLLTFYFTTPMSFLYGR